MFATVGAGVGAGAGVSDGAVGDLPQATNASSPDEQQGCSSAGHGQSSCGVTLMCQDTEHRGPSFTVSESTDSGTPIARAITTEPIPLEPEQVRFLRKWLGLSSADFSLFMGVRPETVSRWENKDAAYPLSPTADRLLRLLVANQDPVENTAVQDK